MNKFFTILLFLITFYQIGYADSIKSNNLYPLGEKNNFLKDFTRSSGTIPLDILIIFSLLLALIALIIIFKIIITRKTSKELIIRRQLNVETAKNNNNSKMVTLGEMTGQIAHEINTPLGTLLLISQSLIKKNAEGSLSKDKLEEQLNILLEITGKISKIVKTMKDFARSGIEAQQEDSSVQKIIDDFLLLSGQKIKRHNAQFEIVYKINKDKAINCCSFQIVQVLLNLTSNALHAIEQVEDRWLKIRLIEKGGLRVEVTDSGKGIPEQAKGKIFNHNFTTKALGEGTGIGLAISKQIIEEHGGKLYLDDQQNHTTFVFEIPFQPMEKSA